MLITVKSSVFLAIICFTAFSAKADELASTPIKEQFSINGVHTGQTLSEVEKILAATKNDIPSSKIHVGTYSVNITDAIQEGNVYGSKIETVLSETVNINGQISPKSTDTLTVLFSDPASGGKSIGIKRLLQWKPGYGPVFQDFVSGITAKYQTPTLFQDDGRSILFIMDKSGQVIKVNSTGQSTTPLSANLDYQYCRSQIIEQFGNGCGSASMFIAIFRDGQSVSEAQFYLKDSAFEMGAKNALIAADLASKRSVSGTQPKL